MQWISVLVHSWQHDKETKNPQSASCEISILKYFSMGRLLRPEHELSELFLKVLKICLHSKKKNTTKNTSPCDKYTDDLIWSFFSNQRSSLTQFAEQCMMWHAYHFCGYAFLVTQEFSHMAHVGMIQYCMA